MIRRVLRWVRADPWLSGALIVAFVLRGPTMFLFPTGMCVRDECSYRQIANDILAGKGFTTPEGWLWAPAWPYVIAATKWATGNEYYTKGVQVVAALACVVLLYRLGIRLWGVREGRAAAWLYALHPTLAFFATTLFTEVLYGFLLLSAVLSLLWAREGPWRRALLTGALIGACVLLRGVATYLAPILLVATLWPDGESIRAAFAARWRHAAAFALAVVLVVAPYSIHVSRRYHAFVISDATLGQMLWVGDNDFAPYTFDWGNGILHSVAADAVEAKGRQHCSELFGAVARDRCETRHGIEWIRNHPGEFFARIPLRLAQMLNPHTFLTRHLRWGLFPGLPFGLKEVLAVLVVLWSFATVVGGSVGGIARARGPFVVAVGGIVLYHFAVISVLAGLSRFRMPIEPFGVLCLAVLVSDPRAAWAALAGSRVRLALALLVVASLVPLMLWFLPHGFPAAV
jgi:4-amino-4-deoxy-L-arabinose transferase-like glycosyltransferase